MYNLCNIMCILRNILYNLHNIMSNLSAALETKQETLKQIKKLETHVAPLVGLAENVAKISGVSAKDIRYLASLFGDPDKKVVSYWCMGMNQHTRGTAPPGWADLHTAAKLSNPSKQGAADPRGAAAAAREAPPAPAATPSAREQCWWTSRSGRGR